MALPTSKELIKLAAACRKAGIKHFRSGDFEFTLSDQIPQSNYKKRQKQSILNTDIATDSLPEDTLLFWSVANPEESTEGNQ